MFPAGSNITIQSAATLFTAQPSFVLITGASRGLGRSIAFALASEVGPNSTFLLLSRSLNDLEDTRKKVLDIGAEKNFKVIVKSVDNSSADKSVFESCLDSCFDSEKEIDNFESAYVIHNAGDIGPQGTPVRNLSDIPQMQSYFSTNLFSVMALNSATMDRFSSAPNIHRLVIVNISSLAGMEPFETWSFYCMGKASRDMLFRVMALEEKDEKIRILNYAPGPLETEMVQGILTSGETNPNILKAFETMKTKDQLLTPDQSAAKLIKLMKMNKFKNGDHIDYFEVEDE